MEEVTKVRMPGNNEIFGRIEEILGASRFKVNCKDSKKRICRIPGKFRKRIKVRIGDIVLIKKWDIDPDEKGDISWIYNKTHANWLMKKGIV